MQPDFIVIGAMKCATSTVCAYLEDHPDVYMVPRAEPNFFSRDENFDRGPEWYGRFFAERTTESICGEGSNDYAAGALYPDSAQRMAALCPRVKIIYMVRHPVERILSAWIQNRVDAGDGYPATADKAVMAMPEHYIDQSLYWSNISRYRAVFPDAQIFVGFMEDLKRNPKLFCTGLTEFLGVRPLPEAQRAHVNPSDSKFVPSAMYSAVNRIPLTGLIKPLLPRRLKQTVKTRLLSRRAGAVRSFSPAVHGEVVAKLREDAETFLTHYGKPKDFWDF